MTAAPVIYWFRRDLRLRHLPGLQAAAATGRPIIACYVHDPEGAQDWAPGGAAKWWLHHSLQGLAASIEAQGGTLLLLDGDTPAVISQLVQHSGAEAVYCSQHYEPWALAQERRVKSTLETAGAALHTSPGALLWSPNDVRTGSGTPYRVFTPFWRQCQSLPEPHPGTASTNFQFQQASFPSGLLADWRLLPSKPDWARNWSRHWTPGEAGAQSTLQRFLKERVGQYGERRDLPALTGTSNLSPHLAFGEIAPADIFQRTRELSVTGAHLITEANAFLRQLAWRDFSYHLLVHYPHIPERAFRPEFEKFPWAGCPEHLTAWRAGQTGYPLVDAGMRQLWQTGTMHNRVRMVVASFLTKHLLIDWRVGQRWFWDTLVDADLANNSCSWQWVAGSGADAAPYFRVFNPIRQGQRFDPEGDYTRRWIPELAALATRHLQSPWEAPASALKEAGITLGQNYPMPIVDHNTARVAALDAYSAMKIN